MLQLSELKRLRRLDLYFRFYFVLLLMEAMLQNNFQLEVLPIGGGLISGETIDIILQIKSRNT